MAYIDTPESKRNEKAKKDISKCNGIALETIVEAGKLSSDYAREYFKIGSKHKINIVGKDHYNREVCEVENYNIKIIQDGYAIPFAQYIPKDKTREYDMAEKQAKQNNKGLWESHKQILECLKK